MNHFPTAHRPSEGKVFYAERFALYADKSALLCRNIRPLCRQIRPAVFFAFLIITISYVLRKPFIYAAFRDFRSCFRWLRNCGIFHQTCVGTLQDCDYKQPAPYPDSEITLSLTKYTVIWLKNIFCSKIAVTLTLFASITINEFFEQFRDPQNAHSLTGMDAVSTGFTASCPESAWALSVFAAAVIRKVQKQGFFCISK